MNFLTQFCMGVSGASHADCQIAVHLSVFVSGAMVLLYFATLWLGWPRKRRKKSPGSDDDPID